MDSNRQSTACLCEESSPAGVRDILCTYQSKPVCLSKSGAVTFCCLSPELAVFQALGLRGLGESTQAPSQAVSHVPAAPALWSSASLLPWPASHPVAEGIQNLHELGPCPFKGSVIVSLAGSAASSGATFQNVVLLRGTTGSWVQQGHGCRSDSSPLGLNQGLTEVSPRQTLLTSQNSPGRCLHTGPCRTFSHPIIPFISGAWDLWEAEQVYIPASDLCLSL